MSRIFMIGILTVFVVVVTAEYEYSAKLVDTLPTYQTLVNQGAESLDYELAHSESTVVLRRRSSEDFGKRFSESSSFCWIDDLVLETENEIIPEKNSFFSYKTRPVRSFRVHDQPGITVSLNSRPESPLRRYLCVLPQECPPKYFGLTEFTVSQMPNRENKLYMNIVLTFNDSDQKEAIKVVMDVFKPPIMKADIAHSTKNQVPVIDYPILRSQFSPGTSPDEPVQENQEGPLLFNILWMDKVLARAKFLNREKDSSGKRSFVYMAGPVIVDLEEYDSLLDMHMMSRV